MSAEEDDLAAAEFALGVLDGAERAAAAARIGTDAGFAAAVARWQGRYAALAPTDRLAELWPAIAARISDQSTAAAGGPDLAPVLRRWRALAAGFAVAAAVLLAVVLRDLREPALGGLSAALTGADRAFVTVSIDPAQRRLVVQPAGLVAALAGRTPELWVVPAVGRPRSLGIIDPTAARALEPSDEVRRLLLPDATLAISGEPSIGSPTGQPTGPIIVSGKIARF